MSNFQPILKKMAFSAEFSPALRTYVPAVLNHHSNAGWEIEFYALNPITNQLERVRYRLNSFRKHFRNTAEFRVQANQMVCSINVKLFNGCTVRQKLE